MSDGVQGRAPVLWTARLEMTSLTEDDAAEMAVVLGDLALHEFIGGTPAGEDALANRYRRWSEGSDTAGETWLNWAIRLRDGGQAAGHLQATVTTGPAGQAAEMAWVIGTRWQRRGYAAEAANALVQWLAEAGVTQVSACIYPGHRASERVAERAGLELTSEVSDGERVWRRELGRPAAAG
ncbi:MAG TPA: GNAT family N-acetyltransferase [Streptosporangiaceae bacterium]